MLEQIKLDRSPRYPVVTNILCQQVNEGNYDQAVSTFEKVLQRNPASPEALVGRGTAYAFQRKLELAIADFTMAIQLDPLAGEAWKRRGQARAALGEIPEAIEDLTKALQFEPKSSDILHERGVVNFKLKDYTAAVKDLSSCVLSDRKNETAYTYLGLALSSLGEYTKAEKALLKSVQIDPKFQEGRTHLSQFYHELAQVEKASKCIQNLISIDNRFAMAYYLHGNLHYGLGDHRSAIKDLSVALSIESSDLESLYLRASSYHAVGDYVEAVKDYDTVIDLKADSMDKFVLQCLAFYQKEIALYTASRVTLEFTVFNIDDDVHPLFKEYWCKRLHPQHVSENVVRQPPLKDALKRGRLKKQDYTFTRQKEILLEAADSIGKRIQYNSPGFLPNRRQYRMAGLAAIDIAQKVSKAWQSLRAEWKSLRRSGAKGNRKNRKSEMGSVASQNRGGAGCSSQSSGSSSSYNPDDDRSLRLRFVISWHDVYSFAVKWRQISEPCDSVVWVNRLSEHKNSAFGSRTSLILGQGKVVRYFPYYQRTLDALKNIMKERAFVNNKANEVVDLTEVKMLQAIVNAECVADLYNIIGQDFWLATTCVSTAFEGKQLEGTRITVEKEDKGFDFAIRTPCTRPRWEDYGAEMTAAWETVCNHYCGEAYGSTDIRMLDNVRDSILRMTYYWYNFMPLSRGSAAVGYVVMLGLFLAANMEVNESIPKGMQVDWEAILSPYPDMFVDSMKAWICPSLKINTSWKELPDVSSAFPTTGLVVAALSTY
ncbi:hypothetical protein AMTR_s00001p00272300 [Amborella trichopoda]|uniref:Uncharacterized protein n=1 Tax=Amborella trichopoda TaxID=13333 RepID=W1NLD3_AMBTC|nr:hypothetical protein AMTR_s00001p00272300 [Amborella trichopoda]